MAVGRWWFPWRRQHVDHVYTFPADCILVLDSGHYGDRVLYVGIDGNSDPELVLFVPGSGHSDGGCGGILRAGSLDLYCDFVASMHLVGARGGCCSSDDVHSIHRDAAFARYSAYLLTVLYVFSVLYGSGAGAPGLPQPAIGSFLALRELMAIRFFADREPSACSRFPEDLGRSSAPDATEAATVDCSDCGGSSR